MRIFLAVKLPPTGILPMLLLTEDSEVAGTSIKELTLVASSFFALRLAVSGFIPVVEMLAKRLCACEEACPNVTGNCRFKARAASPQPGVEFIEFSDPRGI